MFAILSLYLLKKKPISHCTMFLHNIIIYPVNIDRINRILKLVPLNRESLSSSALEVIGRVEDEPNKFPHFANKLYPSRTPSYYSLYLNNTCVWNT